MLFEIICDEFKKERVEFHNGLNVVLGDDMGSNSIGKSSFLMIIDFVFGGKDYVLKSTDIQKNIGAHVIKFAFIFNGKKYYFSRNTLDTEHVSICDEDYKEVDVIGIDQYTSRLKLFYDLNTNDSTFRNVVGRYSRVYGKDNLDEKRPLHVVKTEPERIAVNELLKLCNLYSAISELEELAKNKKEELDVFKKAQKYQFIFDINAKQRKLNEKMLAEAEEEKERITEKINNNLLDIDSEKTDIILKLKSQLSNYNSKINYQKARLFPLQDNLKGKKIFKQEDLNGLKQYFPEIDLRQLEEVQKFHKEIDVVLKQQISEEISNIENSISYLTEKKEYVENQIIKISENSNLSQVILFRFAELQKRIESLAAQNIYFDKKVMLETEKKDAENRKNEMRSQQLNQMQNMINIKMKELNDEIYNGERIPPTLSVVNNKYKFETVDDTGTGTCYRGMVLLDLSVLELTDLPILVHDSVVLKQIEDVAIEKILEMYNKSNKQIFIALDKSTSYSVRSQEILYENKVLELGTNGNELFGRSWSKVIE